MLIINLVYYDNVTYSAVPVSEIIWSSVRIYVTYKFLRLTSDLRAFLLKKALQDSQVMALKLYPNALSPHTRQILSSLLRLNFLETTMSLLLEFESSFCVEYDEFIWCPEVGNSEGSLPCPRRKLLSMVVHMSTSCPLSLDDVYQITKKIKLI